MPVGTDGLDRGVIIKACFGPRGDYKRGRPAVILTSNATIVRCGHTDVMVGSTEQGDPALEVEIPAGIKGHPDVLTGLDDRTFIVCDWECTISVKEIEDVCGLCPDGYVLKVLEKSREPR